MERGSEDIRKRPKLRDKEELRRRVMNQIESESTIQQNKRFVWLRIAASLLVVFSVGAYVWMESDTQLQRHDTIARIENKVIFSKPDWRCRNNMMSLLASFNNSGLQFNNDGSALMLIKSDIELLQDSHPDLYSDAQGFIQALKELYPQLYHQYKSDEAVRLNFWILKDDKRLCQYITQ